MVGPSRHIPLGHRSLRTRVARALVIVGLAVSCTDQQRLTAPATPSRSIIDAAHGGSAGFYFLPPIVPDPKPFAGVFDGSRSPSVRIVCTAATGPSCPTLTSFQMGAGPQGIKVDPVGQSYSVVWPVPADLPLGRRQYQVQVFDGTALLGQADLTIIAAQKDAKSVPSDEVPVVRGSPFQIKFRIETKQGGGSDDPTQPVTCRSCLEAVPGALLLTVAGQTKQLNAFLVDAQGKRTAVAASFESSDPNFVSVSSSGLATAVAVGSTKVVAHYNGQASDAVLVLFALPVSGALLISDDQIVGDIVPVDASADYKPGWRYHVQLKGVTPAVDQVVLNTGFAAVGGKVVSVTPGAGVNDVVLSLLSSTGMFSAIKIHQNLPLVSSAPQGTTQGQSFNVTPRSGAPFTGLSLGAGATRTSASPINFDPSSFSCDVKTAGGILLPITFTTVAVEANPNLTIDVEVDGPFKGIKVTGSLAPRIQLKPTLTASIDGDVECKLKINQLQPKLFGLWSLIAGAQIPYGVGFNLKARGKVAGMAIDATIGGNVTLTLGYDCSIACVPVNEFTNDATGSLTPSNFPTVDNIRTEVFADVFAWAGLRVGNPSFEILQYEILEARAGLRQQFSFAGMEAQAFDAAYASSFELLDFTSVKSSASLIKAGSYLSVSLPPLAGNDQSVLAQSPRGTFSINPNNVDPGNDQALGETATFKVVLDPATYLGDYAVEGVEIRWQKKDDHDNPILEPGRPGCTDIHVTIPFQSTFECTTDFREDQLGQHTFFAFVHAKLFGVSIPIALEVAADGRAGVKVQKSGTVRRRSDDVGGVFAEYTISTTEHATPSGAGYAGSGTASYSRHFIVTTAPGCLNDHNIQGTGTHFTLMPHPTLATRWNLAASISWTQTITGPCIAGSLVTTGTTVFTLGTGREIRDNGTLIGFDFDASGTSGTETTTVTGKLKVN